MTRLDLDGIWQFGPEKTNAETPGTVLGTWTGSKVVPDPYYGENEKSITPLFNREFEYSRTFSVGKELLAHDKAELVCLGIDTLGEVFINEKSVLRVNNMHRSWRVNVKELLKQGENSIRIVLFSSIEYISNAFSKGQIRYISTGGMPGSGYLRKAHCQFGWDWGPQLPDAGIWRSIYLEGWSFAKLADVYIVQEHSPPLSDSEIKGTVGGPVTLRARVKAEPNDLKLFLSRGETLKASMTVTPPDTAHSAGQSETHSEAHGATLSVTALITDITEVCELSLVIQEPQLWYPNGLTGSKKNQPLYNVTVELLDCEAETQSVLDQWHGRIGLRTLTYSADKDQWGREFALTVNGIKVFSMGADYIPEDSNFSKINKERTRRLLEDCVKANFNSIRVWGGGYYPDDYFFDICDELGLVVWQDFMFACNVYELTDEFADNVAEEVRQNIVRIRHHPCLGLWCGNNEMEMGWVGWEGVKHHSPALKADYIKLFEGIIPRIVKECDPQTFYWPSSPSSSGSFDSPNDPNQGDVHFWDVWHGLKPFSEYRKHLLRYCSEFGFQSLPDMETIRSFAQEEDLNLFSPVMEAHQRNPRGNGIILYYISETYRYPKDFPSLVYISQVLQLESIQSGVDHWRRNRGRCMGAIYWQLNDCWPVASWASIDYFGRWKALHYGARRFFAPLRATVFIDNTQSQKNAKVFVHNDTLAEHEGTVSLFLRDRDFNTLAETTVDVKLQSLSACEVLAGDFSGIVNTAGLERSCFVTAVLTICGEPVSKETVLFVPPKHFSFKKPAYSVETFEGGDHFVISVKADTFCRFVRVKIKNEDPVFSDNYFDITGKEGVKIKVSKDQLKKTYTEESLKDSIDDIISVSGSY
jgi:beta-mannosidase